LDDPQANGRGDDEEGKASGVIFLDWKQSKLRRDEEPPINNGCERDFCDASLKSAGKTGYEDSGVEGYKFNDVGVDETKSPPKRRSQRYAQNCRHHSARPPVDIGAVTLNPTSSASCRSKLLDPIQKITPANGGQHDSPDA
jgi:hypothetical protein